MPVTSKMQQIKIWLVILFLSRKTFHAKQIFVLTGFMKLGPGLGPYSTTTLVNTMYMYILQLNDSIMYKHTGLDFGGKNHKTAGHVASNFYGPENLFQDRNQKKRRTLSTQLHNWPIFLSSTQRLREDWCHFVGINTKILDGIERYLYLSV